MRRSYGRRMIAFLMAFIMALSVLFQSDIAIGGIAQVAGGTVTECGDGQ